MSRRSNWDFCFSSSQSKSRPLLSPPGFRAIPEKAVAEEAANAAAQARLLSGDHREATAEARQNARRLVDAVRQKAWSLSWSPVKNLGMNLVMLYFGAGGAGIFTVLVICYAMFNALRTLLSVNTAFQPLEDAIRIKSSDAINPTESAELQHPLARFLYSPFLSQKLSFIAACCCILAYILHQAAKMGILPLRTGDYLGLIPEHKEPCITVAII